MDSTQIVERKKYKERQKKNYKLTIQDGENIIEEEFNNLQQISEKLGISHDKAKRIKDGYYNIQREKYSHRKTNDYKKIKISKL